MQSSPAIVIPKRFNRHHCHSQIATTIAAASRSPTLGDLVRSAHAKNASMARASSDLALNKVILQRKLWRQLQRDFFADGVNADAKCNEPALLPHEHSPASLKVSLKRPSSPTFARANSRTNINQLKPVYRIAPRSKHNLGMSTSLLKKNTHTAV
eukprot:TRINITY_DN7199_c0_g1_i1.p2 TRINITY_DN7199_c0_g1~~TRINITY_DN7199_c0_g1_i1.p2  ORF type:complete len:155 (+),score=33.92 TRINITY_DN7199_c0_g1_i1:1391-1855(+)